MILTHTDTYKQLFQMAVGFSLGLKFWVFLCLVFLTIYVHIKTAEQWTIIQ